MALAGLLLWHVVSGKHGLSVWQQKRREDKQLRKEIDGLQQENARLRERVQKLKSDPHAIEREAREKLHYAKPGEVIYTLPPDPRADPARCANNSRSRGHASRIRGWAGALRFAAAWASNHAAPAPTRGASSPSAEMRSSRSWADRLRLSRRKKKLRGSGDAAAEHDDLRARNAASTATQGHAQGASEGGEHFVSPVSAIMRCAMRRLPVPLLCRAAR